MKKIIILFLFISSLVLAQGQRLNTPTYPSYWYNSGATTISPLSSTRSLSGITNIGLSGNLVPTVTNTSIFGSADYIWQTGYLGTLTLGDDSDNVNGQLNFIADDGDDGNIRIANDNKMYFSGVGYYVFDNLISGGGTLYIAGSTTTDIVVNSSNVVLYRTTYPNATNSYTFGTSTYIWNNGYFGQLTLGDDSDNVNGTLNLVSAGNAQGNIAINDSDQITFNGASGGYVFDAPIINQGLTTDERVVTLADSASISIATGVSGWGSVMIGNKTAYAIDFTWDSDGVPTLGAETSANVATDGTTDNKLQIYDGGSGIVIKNLLGSSLKLAISLKYYTP